MKNITLDKTALKEQVEAWPFGNALNAVEAILEGLNSTPDTRKKFASLRADLAIALVNQFKLNDEARL